MLAVYPQELDLQFLVVSEISHLHGERLPHFVQEHFFGKLNAEYGARAMAHAR